MKKPLVLVIMDGFGIAPAGPDNAITTAATPRLDKLFAEFPHTQIGASGMDVGLPDGQMGNSEVGHTNIGAGRVVYQELTRITKAINDGGFFENKALSAAVDNCKKKNSALHIMGLMSDGGVHSHNSHIYALLELAVKRGLNKIFLHCFMDGRDVSTTSGAGFLEEVNAKVKALGAGSIATVMGRYYAMDRDTQWDRVKKAYDAMTAGSGVQGSDAPALVRKSYEDGVTDEFIIPSVCDKNGVIQSGDSVIFANFRPDRAREITRAFVDPEFKGFERARMLDIFFVTMTSYDATMPNVTVAYPPQSLDNTFGEYISKVGLTQFRIAETTKYPHVTFFFNGGRETVYANEDRALIPTPDVATFDLKPEMSAYGITDEVEKRIRSGKYDAVILNFANCDMVGHTGVFDAAVKAVETVDECVGRVYDAVTSMDGTLIVTADHGNADRMVGDDGAPFTPHTTNPVPFLVAGCGNVKLRSGGRLADIAPTMLKLLGLKKPAEMDGESIIL